MSHDYEQSDSTGKPRSDNDLTEAIEVILELMRNPPMNLPMLVLNLPNIKELLVELQSRRRRD